ncbi:MAG: helix-turn-helix domain-containing protein [Planctomycetes bacterium]|nr:helix-turn-helix domain-containing protein [Planctomycetota bacterium]
MLRQWRLDAGLTQRELGRRLKRPHTFVHKTETGDRRIDPIEFVRWCRACGQDPARCIAQVSDRKRS